MRFFTRFLLISSLVSPVFAVSIDDPLAVERLAPPRPSPQDFGRPAGMPCGDPAAALRAAPLTAVSAVDLALCNHPQTRELWATARAQAALVGVARGAWLPTVGASASSTRVDFDKASPYTTENANVQLSWLLIDFGQRSANVEYALQLLAAAAATQDATVQTLFLGALQAYYTGQATRAAVVSAREAERSANEAYKAAETRYQVGVATPADRLQARTALSQATLNRIRAEGDARNALGSLANAVGLPANAAIELAATAAVPDNPAFQQNLDALIADAQRRRPDLKAAEARFKAAEAAVDSARALGRPTLSLIAGPAWLRDNGETFRGDSVGLKLNIPIFTGFDTTYRVRNAQAAAEVQAAQRERLRNQVALDVWKAYQSLSTATQSLQTAADLVASAEQSERVALGRYRAGVGTVLDLLSAQSALANARLQRIQAELDWNVYRATLAQAMGALDYTLLEQAAEGKQ